MKTFRSEIINFVDFETTGLNTRKDEICEIGAVKAFCSPNGDGDDIIVLGELSMITQVSDKNLEKTFIHNISKEEIKKGMEISKASRLLWDFCSDQPIAGHNFLGFDYKFIKRKWNELGLTFKNRIIDTLIISKQALKTKSYSLLNLSSLFSIERSVDHRALSDAYATARIYQKLITGSR